MGLSIHYSGSIKEQDLVAVLATEVEDICQSMGWEYHTCQQKDFSPVTNNLDYTPEHLTGISINIEGCETIS
jgi:hypothetical protein